MLAGVFSTISDVISSIYSFLQSSSTYYLDMSKVLHIWYSDNPNEYLPALNKYRLIRKRIQNPFLTFYLLYSSECITSEAVMKDLISFTTLLNIQLVDLDTDLANEPKSDLDQKIFELIKLEIAYARTQKGGNLAAASDLTRLLEAVIKLGNYIDFDIDIEVAEDQEICKVKSPVIIAGGVMKYGEVTAPAINNHFVGVARTSYEDTTPHPDALECLNHIKTKIIENYENPRAEFFLEEFPKCPNMLGMNSDINDWIHDIFKNNKCSIFEYRNIISSAYMDDNVRSELYKNSVMQTTGPTMWYWLFKNTVERLGSAFEGTFSLDTWRDLLNNVDNVGYAQNDLGKMIKTNDIVDTLAECFKNVGEKSIEVEQFRCDSSWTPLGAQRLKERSKKVDENLIQIQSACRRYKVWSEINNL